MLANTVISKYIKKCAEAGLQKGAMARVIGVSRTSIINWEKALAKGEKLDILSSTLENMLTATQKLEGSEGLPVRSKEKRVALEEKISQ